MKRIISVALISALLMTGCGKGAASGKSYIQDIEPNIVEISNGYGYFYVVDANTGVVYLKYESGYHGAITVMLNADGTPITAEQLGIKY